MTAERFTLDSNILVYATDSQSAQRHGLALSLVDRATGFDCVLTRQSLGEFFHAVTRKRIAKRADAARQVRNWMGVFPTVGIGDEALLTAVEIATAGQLSFWDAAMVATAEDAGCTLLLSEDMHDGMRFGNLTVRHPFAGGRLADDVRVLVGFDR